MGANLLDCALVCECNTERRAPTRRPEGWKQQGSKVVRYYHGHQLRLEPVLFDGRCMGWFKWLDDHYRGVDNKLDDAERMLEGEADHLVSAWKRKQAWEDAGAPERRNRA